MVGLHANALNTILNDDLIIEVEKAYVIVTWYRGKKANLGANSTWYRGARPNLGANSTWYRGQKLT